MSFVKYLRDAVQLDAFESAAINDDQSSFIDATANYAHDLLHSQYVEIFDETMVAWFEGELTRSKPKQLALAIFLVRVVEHENGKKRNKLAPGLQWVVEYDRIEGKGKKGVSLRLDDGAPRMSHYFVKRVLGIQASEECAAFAKEVEGLPDLDEKIEFVRRYCTDNNLDIVSQLQSDKSFFVFRNDHSKLSVIQELDSISNQGVLFRDVYALKQVRLKNSIIESSRYIQRSVQYAFSELNQEQERCVSLGLTENLTVVTGPPGTGKSQVVLNLLTNQFIERKPTLFASYNNKALDVVINKFRETIDSESFFIRVGNRQERDKAIEVLRLLVKRLEMNEFGSRYSMDELESRRSECQSDLEKKDSESADLKRRHQALRSKVFELRMEVRQSQQPHEQQLHSVHVKERELEQCAEDITRLDSACEDLRKKLQEYEKDISEKQRLWSGLQQRIGEIQKELRGVYDETARVQQMIQAPIALQDELTNSHIRYHKWAETQDVKLRGLFAEMRSEEEKYEKAFNSLPVFLRDDVNAESSGGRRIVREELAYRVEKAKENLHRSKKPWWTFEGGLLRIFSRSIQQENRVAYIKYLESLPASAAEHIETSHPPTNDEWHSWYLRFKAVFTVVEYLPQVESLRKCYHRRSRLQDELESEKRGFVNTTKKHVDNAREKQNEIEIAKEKVPACERILKECRQRRSILSRELCSLEWTKSVVEFGSIQDLNTVAAYLKERPKDHLGLTDWKESFLRVCRLYPIWIVTNLSLRTSIPLAPDLFDLCVIDEASQSDIGTAVPIIARAKRLMVIGDENQLQHITSVSSEDSAKLRLKHDIDDKSSHLDYHSYSLFSCYKAVAAAENLRQHYRCHPSIAKYSSLEFYDGYLFCQTDENALKSEHRGIYWLDVKGKYDRKQNSAEINDVAKLVKTIKEKEKGVSVGVCTPFTNQRASLARALNFSDVTVDTVHGFQGDERDVMVFSPSISSGEDPSIASSAQLRNSTNWINDSAWQLLNVAVTRARSALYIVGDFDYCKSVQGHLGKLAAAAEAEGRVYKSFHDLPVCRTAAANQATKRHSRTHRKSDAAEIEEWLRLNDVRQLYHFTDAENISSIIKHGGLYSREGCDRLGIKVPKPGGNGISSQQDVKLGLQDYVRTSMVANHPMMYAAMKDRLNDPVILLINPDICLLEPTLFCNTNAARSSAQLGKGVEHLKTFRMDVLNQFTQFDVSLELRHYYQAEILVKEFIPIEFIYNIWRYV
jgi:superfamily I DNA and/or RNA helicase